MALNFSCDDTIKSGPYNLEIDEIVDLLMKQDEWNIEHFIEDRWNETSTFVGFTISFKEEGEVLVQRRKEVVEGYYQLFMDDGQIELALNFSEHSLLHELNDDWYYITADQNSIRFEDGGVILVFKKQQ